MYEWEKLCFQCEVEPEKDGKFFCSTRNKGCKIKQGVDKGELPERALQTGAPVTKQESSGVKDEPLWKPSDNMSSFCRKVMKFPENRINWRE